MGWVPNLISGKQNCAVTLIISDRYKISSTTSSLNLLNYGESRIWLFSKPHIHMALSEKNLSTAKSFYNLDKEFLNKI